MKVARVKMPYDQLMALKESKYKPAEDWRVDEVYTETEEIKNKEVKLAVAKQLVKDLNKELYELKFPKHEK